MNSAYLNSKRLSMSCLMTTLSKPTSASDHDSFHGQLLSFLLSWSIVFLLVLLFWSSLLEHALFKVDFLSLPRFLLLLFICIDLLKFFLLSLLLLFLVLLAFFVPSFSYELVFEVRIWFFIDCAFQWVDTFDRIWLGLACVSLWSRSRLLLHTRYLIDDALIALVHFTIETKTDSSDPVTLTHTNLRTLIKVATCL